ncbi:MAG: SpoIID/LytB domain-containing protein, partial [Clostridia bacterium]|nr:SpoIID/LytB domain-containing protein [Clostridia bacterium]
MINIRRIVALALALMLCSCALAESFVEWIFGEPAPTPAATDAPVLDWADWDELETATEAPELPELTAPPTSGIPASSLEDDGMLRVWLKSLDAPQALHLTLSGSYAVEGDRGFRFDKDARVTLTWEENEIWLSVDGLTLDMGPALTLTRHLDGWGEAGGILIDEAEKPNLYCGDLSVAAGSAGMKVVLGIHVEDYLKGVVAYEMSDSFPLEALKAQAVAARTYAMKRKWAAGKRDYDLVDTTADQVFKGYDPEYTNVSDAVDDTRGLVGVYGGGFASCYYSASNGGQTALAGQLLGDAAADGYLDMRDDPYDLENPRSLENDLTVTARCEGSPELKDMLVAALKPVMEAEGFKEDQWEFDAIEAIEPVDPRFEGSRLYDGLAFDLRLRVEFVGLPEEAELTVFDPAQLDENGQPLKLEPEEDGSFLLLPGK